MAEAPRLRPTRPARYGTLDGMRGIAAIAVAIYHFRGTLTPHGYIAVDFFFCLSGFVLLEAYRGRVDGGLRTGPFLKARWLRLYPLYFVALALGIARYGEILSRHDIAGISASDFYLSIASNLVLLPSFVNPVLFPLSGQAWSLFCELLINALMIPLYLRLDRRGLAIFVAAAGAILTITAWLTWAYAQAHGIRSEPFDGGWMWDGIHLGVLRALFAFPMGMLASELLRGAPRRTSAIAFVPLAILAAIMLSRAPHGWEFAFNAVAIIAVLPGLVFMGSRFELPSLAGKVARWAGDVSFALYMVHWILTSLVAKQAQRLGLPAWLELACYLVIVLFLADVLTRWFDPLVRRRIARRRTQAVPG
ncbi:acyltransferase family protein [Parablastomonas sp. CN1-191]|uniref:acyltransferase family protein n=1 Tax=Parablastomonas sp. CN1-191 TaxID=3400908 RepID=UPI003BF8C240